jgi:hypothetical protein
MSQSLRIDGSSVLRADVSPGEIDGVPAVLTDKFRALIEA